MPLGAVRIRKHTNTHTHTNKMEVTSVRLFYECLPAERVEEVMITKSTTPLSLTAANETEYEAPSSKPARVYIDPVTSMDAWGDLGSEHPPR